jgi:hypothetical protein
VRLGLLPLRGGAFPPRKPPLLFRGALDLLPTHYDANGEEARIVSDWSLRGHTTWGELFFEASNSCGDGSRPLEFMLLDPLDAPWWLGVGVLQV